MKKNLRIVSAAAAALLAVAPIAAAAAPVNAAAPAANATNSSSDYSHINLSGNTVTAKNDVTNVNPSFILTGVNGNIPGNLTGSISATVNGVSASANLFNGENGHANVKLTSVHEYPIGSTSVPAGSTIYDGTASTVVNHLNQLVPGQAYNIVVNNLGFNFGANNAGKKVTLALPKNGAFSFTGSLPTGWTSSDAGKTITGKLDNNGTVNHLEVSGQLTALDTANTSDVEFYNVATGAQATQGNVTLVVNANGELNTDALLQAVKSNYVAVQNVLSSNQEITNGGRSDVNNVVDYTNTIEPASDVKAQLKSQNVTVDGNNNFKAPHTFTVTYRATSKGQPTSNGRTKDLKVTFTVANVAAPAQETGVNKTIMHIAAIYDKNGKKTSASEIGAYNTVSVVATPVELKDASGKSLGRFYKIAGKDQYIKVGNIDGTLRTLGHNAYIYHRVGNKFVARTHKVGKKTRHIVAKKGTQEKTYGSPLFGKKYYRIDRNRYIKVANFR